MVKYRRTEKSNKGRVPLRPIVDKEIWASNTGNLADLPYLSGRPVMAIAKIIDAFVNDDMVIPMHTLIVNDGENDHDLEVGSSREFVREYDREISRECYTDWLDVLSAKLDDDVKDFGYLMVGEPFDMPKGMKFFVAHFDTGGDSNYIEITNSFSNDPMTFRMWVKRSLVIPTKYQLHFEVDERAGQLTDTDVEMFKRFVKKFLIMLHEEGLV